MKKIDLTNFEGTADQLGEQVFKQLIAPMLDEMKSQDTDSARLFAFSILWLCLASYANQFEPEGAKKSINFTVDKFMSAFDEFNKRSS